MVGIHIVDEFTGATEWPNRDGCFNLADFGRDSYIKVQGRKKCGTPSLLGVGGLQSLSYQNSTSPSTSGSTTGYSSMFRFPLFYIF